MKGIPGGSFHEFGLLILNKFPDRFVNKPKGRDTAVSKTPAPIPRDACRPAMNAADRPTSDPNNATPSTLPVCRVALSTPQRYPSATFHAAEQRRCQWRHQQSETVLIAINCMQIAQ